MNDKMIAGAIAGGCTRMICAPLDLLKIRYQLEIKACPDSKRTSLLEMIRKVHCEEGVRGFWRGNIAATYLWVSYSAVQFGVYGFAKEWWFAQTSSTSLLGTIMCSSSAALVATTVTYPFDFMSTIFAAQGVPRVFSSFRALIQHTWKTQGFSGFYRGLYPAITTVMPYMGLNFAAYEEMRNISYTPTTSGAIAGLSSKLMVYPLDTIKRRMQMQTVLHGANLPRYSSSLQCFHSMCRDEGVLALYRGTVPSVGKAIVASSCTFTVYEYVLRQLTGN